MTVFVDSLFQSQAYHGDKKSQAAFVGARTGHKWCHMIADSEDELHAMAKKIGLKLGWAQYDHHGIHYDLTPSKRALALKAGAIELTAFGLVDKMREIRDGTVHTLV